MTSSITLESVKNEFIHWRASRTSSNEAIPDLLKTHGIELLQHYKKSHIIAALEINHSTLKKWQTNINQTLPAFVPLAAEPEVIFDELTTPLTQETSATLPLCANLKVTLRNERGIEMCITGEMTSTELLSLADAIVGCRGETS